MKTIYKYELGLTQEQEGIDMPVGAKIIKISNQHYGVCIWAIVDTEMKMEKRTFAVYGTGHEIKMALSKLNHLGTINWNDGNYIWHIFEILK